MPSIIAEYDTFARARRAVRSLEPHLSIQDIVITEQLGHTKPHSSGRALRLTPSTFSVRMDGIAESVENARGLLRAWDKGHA